jgi:hypothetical protein
MPEKPRVSDEQAKRYMANLENGDYDPDEYSDTLLDLQACRRDLREALKCCEEPDCKFLEEMYEKYGWHDD